jgi:uncharacterized protein with von Willebrand factor type A (vWA) domain
MFVDFFFELKKAGIPATIREYLVLLEAMEADVAGGSVEEFYFLSRAALVKDERYYDSFDLVFDRVFKGAEAKAIAALGRDVPEEWLRAAARRVFSEEELAKLEAMGLDVLLKALSERMGQQRGPHRGGNKWIGTGGTSPFGHGGRHPTGIRIGGPGGEGSAVKVWEKREFKSLAGEAELGTRNMKMALRRLRRLAREGAPDEFDLDGTIRATADNAGWLDIRMQAERRNRVKVLLLLDIGGSMDWHVRASEQLFTAARAEFRHLETFYFHNCVYESVWREDVRGRREHVATRDLINTYGADWRLILVGDATMSPYELTEPGGSVGHWNEEPGQVWLSRLIEAYPAAAWLNPVQEAGWSHATSLKIVRRLMGGRMYPLTMDGLDRAMAVLKRTH